MPKGILQEKFQVTAERPKRQDREWATFESQRVTHRMDKTNHMPPGMNIDKQKTAPKDRLRDGGLAGSTDESNSVNGEMLKKGFQHQNMKPEDEMYNQEHVELFYGEATVDGVTGFCERNNYLDRE